MPLFRSAGGAAVISGRGGFHAGAANTFPYELNTSSAEGALGTITLSGNGQTIATTSASSVTGDRDTLDPWFAGNIVYALSAGSLPPGLSLNTSTGAISGSYTIAGQNDDATYNFQVSATSGDGLHVSYRSYSIALSVPFFYKQIVTIGYVVGGYQNNIPYRNVNSVTLSNDTLANIGEMLGAAGQYVEGLVSKNHSYAFGTDDGVQVGTARTDKWAMRTNTAIAYSSPRNMVNPRNDLATAPYYVPQVGYIFGGGTATVEKFTFSTDTSSNTPASSSPGTGPEQAGTASIWNDSAAIITGGSANKFTFSTETNASFGPSGWTTGTGQQKGMSGKLGKGYIGNEGTYARGYNFRVYTWANDTHTTVAKPAISSHPAGYGEENMMAGQHWGYILGIYNESTGQLPDAIKWLFPTETGYYFGNVNLGAAPEFNVGGSGIPGRSSGHCAWRD